MTWIRLACERNGVPELIPSITVEWNSRFTRRMGDALYSPITFQAKIRLSTPLWPRATEQDRFETVVHETCHVIVKYRFNPLIKDHGPEWKEAMRNCGVEPLRLHSVDRTGLARRQRRFALLGCPNQGIDHKCRITAKEFNQLRRGTEFYCKRCGLVVTRESAMEEDRVTLHVPLSVQQASTPNYPDQEQQVATSVSSHCPDRPVSTS